MTLSLMVLRSICFSSMQFLELEQGFMAKSFYQKVDLEHVHKDLRRGLCCPDTASGQATSV